MRKWILGVFLLINLIAYSQTYNHSNGSVLFNCLNTNFYDNGGSGANYPNNSNVTQTFTPSSPCSNIRISFSSPFNLENNFDFLYIYNGPSISSPLIGRYTGSTLPPTITSSSVDGSLTFRFTSDGSTRRSGWVSTLSCVAKPPQFTINAGADKVVPCYGNTLMNASITPIPTTSSQIFTYSGSGRDCDNFLIGGITSGMPSTATITSILFNATIGTNCTSWYEWDFLANDNYIGSGCNSTGNIYNGLNGQFANGQTFRLRSWDNDFFCDNITMGLTLTVNYTVPTPIYTWSPNIVNTYTTLSNTSVLNPTVTPASTTTYTLSASSNGCSYSDQVLITMPCALPIELFSFSGLNLNERNLIKWVTLSETSNDYFLLERSITGEFNETTQIAKISGNGNSSSKIEYYYQDNGFPHEINYYRLTQVDFDGNKRIYDPISIDNTTSKYITKYINVLGQEINEYSSGLVFKVYNDGSISKIWR